MLFLETLEQACRKTDWQVHAWCLMLNHFHLVIETPKATLASLEQPGVELDRNDEIHERDLLHHFNNSQSQSKSKIPVNGPGANQTGTPGYAAPNSAGTKAIKPEKDIQLDKAISILEDWSKYKVQLAKADDAPAAAVSRTTMLAFSALGNTDALATSRRMSRPDIGLAMTPTVASATSRWRLTRQPLACCSPIVLPASRRRACRLRDTRFRSR